MKLAEITVGSDVYTFVGWRQLGPVTVEAVRVPYKKRCDGITVQHQDGRTETVWYRSVFSPEEALTVGVEWHVQKADATRRWTDARAAHPDDPIEAMLQYLEGEVET